MKSKQQLQTSGAPAKQFDSPGSSYRFVILAAPLLMQPCLGMTYSRSLCVKPLRQLLGISQASAQLPFTLFYIAFPLTAIFAGTLLARRGPRFCAMLGGLVFGGGWMLADLGTHSLAWIVSGIGLLGGMGVGFAYLVPIATCIQWFPEQKGLVTGIAVAGFGGGSALVAKVGGYCMTTLSIGPCDLFRYLGAITLVIVCLAGALMRRPASLKQETGPLYPVKSVLSNRAFRLLYFAMFTGLAAGFAVNANLKELGLHGAAGSGVLAIALFAIANAGGRLVWGMLSDRFPVISMIRLNLLLQVVILLTTALVIRLLGGLSAGVLVVVAGAAGFNYGGVLVLYASATAQRYGAEHVGRVYGWMFSSNVPASFAPVLAALAYDRTGSFVIPFAGVALLMIAAAWSVGIYRTRFA